MSQQNPSEPSIWLVQRGFKRMLEGSAHIEIEYPDGMIVTLPQDALLAAAVVIRDLETPQALPRE